MIATIETRRVVTVELERSEIHNLLQGSEIRGHVQVRHKGDDIPVDISVCCSNPEKDIPPKGITDED